MTKIKLVFALLFFMLIAPTLTNAQFTKMLDLSATASGKNPVGALFNDGIFLYGTTVIGGTNNLGTMYKIKPDGTGYQKLIDFDGANNGANPYGSFVSDGTYLYGMTQDGGAFNVGTIFKIKPDGSSYVKIFDFSGVDGANPQGTFYFDGVYLYGMTQFGGADNGGIVFKIKTDGSGFYVLYEFVGTYDIDPWTGNSVFLGYLDGNGPTGSLTSDGVNLYGMTSQGGQFDNGVIFTIDNNGFFTQLHSFSGTDGDTPFGSLILNGGVLYGLTSAGGTNNKGVVFNYNINTFGFTKLHDFSGGADGGNPSASLIYDNAFLYGTASTGGVNNKGVIFKIKNDGTGFSKLFDFSGLANGQTPSGALISDGNHLYGTAFAGGANSAGVIFKYYDLISSVDQIGSTCSAQCSGYANVTVSKGVPPYTFTWNTSPVQTAATAVGLCAGNYTVTITDAYGSSTKTVTISSQAPPATPSICVVTVDETSNFNVIAWDKMGYSASDTFIVYRDISNNNYQRIGSVPYDSLSMFTDTVRYLYAANGNPNASSWRYKISAKDSCGSESALSPFHQSLFLQNNSGNFTWTEYKIEGQILPIPALQNYLFRRDNLSNGNWQTIQTLSASSLTYTDPDFSLYPNSRYIVETSWSISCDPSLRMLATINTTKSNTKDLRLIGPNSLKEINAAQLDVYPNPAKDILNMVLSNQEAEQISIFDVSGRLVQQQNAIGNSGNIQVQIGELSNGLYLLQVNTNKGLIRQTFVKE